MSIQLDTSKIKYGVYARKSTESEDRQVASTTDQIKAMERVIEREGGTFKIEKRFEEQKSGFVPYKREKFDEMIQMIRDGKINGIITWKLSRLSRNPEEAGIIMGLLQRHEIQHIRTADRNWLPTDNIINPSVEFAMSNQSSIETSTDTKRGLIEKAERGWSPHSVLVMGYKHTEFIHVGIDDEIIPDPERFDLFKRGVMHIIEGRMEPKQALKWMTEQGLRVRETFKSPKHPLPYNTFCRLLGDRFYVGEFTFKGKLFYGKHTKMFTDDEWDKLQFRMGRKDRPRPQKHFFPFSGLMKCGECGCSIIGDPTIKILKDGTVRRYLHYHCSKKKGKCEQKTINVDKLDGAFMELLQNIEIPESFHKWAIEQLKSEHSEEIILRQDAQKKNRKLYDEVEAKLDRLMNLRLGDLITEDEFKAKKKTVEEEKRTLKMLVDNTDNRQAEWIEKMEKGMNFAENAKTRFDTKIPEVQKEVMFNLGSNYILKDRKVKLDIDSPIKFVEKIAPEARRVVTRFELTKKLGNTDTLEVIFANNLTMGRLQD